MTCKHHFVIPRGGVTVIGTCKLCGETREFQNTVTDKERKYSEQRAKRVKSAEELMKG